VDFDAQRNKPRRLRRVLSFSVTFCDCDDSGARSAAGCFRLEAGNAETESAIG